jgi:hypothetical protein
VVIDAWGLRAPLWLGAVMAVAGLATVLPALVRRAAADAAPVTAPAAESAPVRPAPCEQRV